MSTTRLTSRVAQDALGQAAVEAREAVRVAVIDGEDEGKVDGVPRAPASSSRALRIAASSPRRRAEPGPDPIELAAYAVAQPFLATRDVADLVRGPLRALVVAGFDEEHVSASPSVP